MRLFPQTIEGAFMKSRILGIQAFALAAVGAMSFLACSSDDNTTPAPTGSGGAAGAGGTAGAAGTGVAGAGGRAGAAGNAGAGGTTAGSGGAADSGPRDSGGRDVTADCGVAGVIHTAPTVPPPIAAPTGAVLVAG